MIRVIHPGLQTTVQDLGRPGIQATGVPESGAVDPVALRVANRLVGNELQAACLEIPLMGPTLEALSNHVLAVTGADLGLTVNGRPVPNWEAFSVASGDILQFQGLRSGCRAYLAVAGGLEAPTVLGSRSTDLLGKLGREPLKAGDRLEAGPAVLPPEALVGRRLPPEFHQVYPAEIEVRFVPGPQADYFQPEALQILTESVYTINPRSDRMGCRLDGPALPHRGGADIISDGMPLGGIQVPPDGRPIVLLQGRQTMGGYTKIGVVISPDVARVGQLPPGGRLRFRAVTREEAHLIYRVSQDHLAMLLEFSGQLSSAALWRLIQ